MKMFDHELEQIKRVEKTLATAEDLICEASKKLQEMAHVNSSVVPVSKEVSLLQERVFTIVDQLRALRRDATRPGV